MADIKGLGDCGICHQSIQDPKTGTSGPIRHFNGHQLAHKACFETWSSEDQRLMRVKETADRLRRQIAAMQGDLEAAEKSIAELENKASA